MANMSAFKAQLISIHAPRAGGDVHRSHTSDCPRAFQSTPPVRGATIRRRCKAAEKQLFQSTPPVRGATIFQCFPRSNTVISIHAPRAGSDGITAVCKYYLCIFQSTLPVRGATEAEATRSLIQAFQSTLPVRGATIHRHPKQAEKTDFNPRSPCGERLNQIYLKHYTQQFQSTLPVRGATIIRKHLPTGTIISIHAPRAGSDRQGQ